MYKKGKQKDKHHNTTTSNERNTKNHNMSIQMKCNIRKNYMEFPPFIWNSPLSKLKEREERNNSL